MATKSDRVYIPLPLREAYDLVSQIGATVSGYELSAAQPASQISWRPTMIRRVLVNVTRVCAEFSSAAGPKPMTLVRFTATHSGIVDPLSYLDRALAAFMNPLLATLKARYGWSDGASSGPASISTASLPSAGEVCPACSAIGPAEALFCDQCGGAMPARCPACGAVVERGSSYCELCGAGQESPLAAG